MATRTAPTVDGTPTVVHTTLHLVDASGDNYAESIKTLTAPTDAEVEAWAAAYQGATQASLWKVSVSLAYEGDEDADNADVGQRNSIKDGINLAYKNVTTQDTTSPRLVAPIPATMQGNQDIPLLTATEFTALLTAQGAILSGYSLKSAQYTEHRERKNNARVKV